MTINKKVGANTIIDDGVVFLKETHYALDSFYNLNENNIFSLKILRAVYVYRYG
jgi:hypothetical protein